MPNGETRKRCRARLGRLLATCLVLGAVGAPAAVAFPLSDPPLSLGVVPGPFAVLDFNGDGIPDVAGVRGAGQAYLVLGTATGAAPEQTVTLPATGSFKAVTAADLDADGNDDLVISVDQDAALVVLRGRADGVLTAPAAPDVHAIAAPTPGLPRNTSVTAGDVDGDGDPDVIAAVGSAGDFGTPADTTASGTVTVFVNDGSGGLTATPTPLAVNAPAAMMLVLLAGDGDPDLIVAQRNAPAASSLAVFPGAAGAGYGAPAFVDGGATAAHLAAGDFNGDALTDLVVGHADVGGFETPAVNPVSIVPGTGVAAGLGARKDVPQAAGSEVLAADLDRDGRDDLYVADGRPRIPFPGGSDDPIFLRGLGALQFGAPDQSPTPFERFEFDPQLADFDGDGRADVITGGAFGNVPPDSHFIRFGLGPQLLPDLAEVDFADTALGTASAIAVVRFTNAGPGAATGITTVSSGNAGDFPVQSNTCNGATMPVDGSCTITVRFAPSTTGDRSAFLGPIAADGDAVFAVALFGTGVSPPPPAAAGAPAAPAPPAPVATVVPAPRVVLLAAPAVRAITRAALLRRGLAVVQRAGAAGTVRFDLTMQPRPGRARVVARLTRRVSRPSTLRVRLRLTASGRRLVRSRRPATLNLRTTFTGSGGRRATTIARVLLR